MASVHDVANYILEQAGPMSAMKLQKLVYYAQAWTLVWDETPLFESRIEAWVNGPVCRELYDSHRGRFTLSADDMDGSSSRLSDRQRANIDAVVDVYGKKSSQWLSDLTHKETPWQRAREGLRPSDRGNSEIQLDWMMEFYESL